MVLSILLSTWIAAKAKPVAAEPVLEVGTAKLRIEIAADDSARSNGLSKRSALAWDRGMLFVFPSEEERVFWMIDCSFDLDIAYLDRDGVVRDEQTMVAEPGVPPQALRRYPSASNRVQYALEVNRGWLSAHKLRVGDTLRAVKAWTTRR